MRALRMKTLVLMCLATLATCLSAFAQNPVLDDWATPLRNQIGSPYPLIGNGNDADITASGNKLHVTADQIGGGYYDVVSIVDQGPGATPPYPFNAGDCGAFGATYRCYIITFAQPQAWVTDSVTNLSMRRQFWVWHNLSLSGGSCSRTAWNAFSDHDLAAPTMTSMVAAAPGDRTHVWFNIDYNQAGNFDLTNCSFTSGQIYNNCSKSCGNTFFFLALPYDVGRVHGYVKSGTFDETVHNRLNFSYIPTGPNAFLQSGTNFETAQIGMYEGPLTNNAGDAGRHFYSGSWLGIYPGRRVYAKVTNRYGHIPNGYPSPDAFPINYAAKQGYGGNLMKLMTYFYFSAVGSGRASGWIMSRTNIAVDEIDYTHEPEGGVDGLIYAPWWTYTGPLAGVTTGRYEVSFQQMVGIHGVTHTRYHTSDMRSVGWSAGTAGDDMILPASTESHHLWTTPDVAEAPTMYLALRPGVEVGNAATGPNGDVMVTAGNQPGGFFADMLYGEGDNVAVSGVGGCTKANNGGSNPATWSVHVLPSKSYRTSVWPTGFTGANAEADDFTLSTSAGVATVTDLRGAHGLSVGRLVKWLSPGEQNHCDFSPCSIQPTLGVITSVPDSTHFTFNWAATGTFDPAYNGGLLYVAEAYELVGSGACNAGFTTSPSSILIATDNTKNFFEMTIPAQTLSPNVTPPSLTGGVVGTAYSQTLTASLFSGTVTWSLVSGTLPTGLSGCTSGTGTTCSITGAPTTTSGSPFAFIIRATDGTSTVDTPYTVTIGAGASPSVSPTSLPSGTAGAAYSQMLTASNFTGTVTWSLLSGALPTSISGCTNTGATCTLSGTPSSAATFSFTIRASNGATNVDTAYSVTIAAAAPAAGGSTVSGRSVIGGRIAR